MTPERDEQAVQAVETPASIPAADTAETERASRLLAKSRRRMTGTFAYNMDSKGRVVVPPSFRERLGEGFVIAATPDFKAIVLYNALEWAEYREHFDHYRKQNSRELRTMLLYLDKFTYQPNDIDSQGRVLLPTELRAIVLGDEKELDISGNSTHVEIRAKTKAMEAFGAYLANTDSYMDAVEALEPDAEG